ncbi:MAG: 30S ribosomal protein S13 [Candidatus Nanoarchaeia archaeon]|nr:30S ribosomal protein S13 [Candidatus Nanoarchaeia archaeon]MDD5358084.1 30S ribosomal protein S13 [Candidatus Nanoarchaeia archaeon]MDD5589272.1 30S ribosomal protein S13 [Candidatus Nanoarchaeia archaeon]
MTEAIHKGKPMGEKFEGKLIRILSKDIEGELKVYVGLTKIKGISWGLANAICKVLHLDKNRKIGSLSKEEIESIGNFVKNPTIPVYLLNRRIDIETGKNKHLIGNDLDLQKEFDIGRLKKIKSYRGLRHAVGLPVRGQRTKSHFRKNKKKGVGIKKKTKPTEGVKK